MSKYIEIISDGITYFVHPNSAAGHTFNLAHSKARTDLMALSDFVFDKAGQLIKSRYVIEDIIRLYCKQEINHDKLHPIRT